MKIAELTEIQTKEGTEEGDICGKDGCDGVLGYEPAKNCSCHLNPPCSVCVDNPLVCLNWYVSNADYR